MIKAKKVPLPALVSELIMQHQERPNGQGFPKKLMADALHKDLNYVLVAYEFQKLTSLSPGEEKRTPLAAAQKLLDEALAGTNGLDFTLCKKLVGLLS